MFIDPPYNTGNENWLYNDNVSSSLTKEWLRENAPVDGDDLERHDKWLCMMWPRLHLLKELIADDGVIFISIDDNEQHHLRMLMDTIFGEERFIMHVAWKKRGGPPNDRPIASVHDHILIYGSESSLLLRPRPEGHGDFSNPDDDPNGPWRLQQIHGNAKGGRWVDALYYPIIDPTTKEEYLPPPSRNWVHSKDVVEEMIATGEIIFGRDGTSAPQRKRYLRDVRPGLTWPSIWQSDNHDDKFPTNRDGTSELTQIFGQISEFDTPKPVGLVDRCVRMSAGPDAIILDSFAGSGTTAHAVLSLNQEDGGNRRFILVECEDYADTITAERVRRVIKGVPDAKDEALQNGLGGSFTYCTLGDAIDAESMLTGKSLPEYGALASYLLHTASGLSADPERLSNPRKNGRFHSTKEMDYYLYYEPDKEWLSSKDAMLDEKKVKAIAKREKPATVFAAGKHMSQRELTEKQITFCQLPYELTRTG